MAYVDANAIAFEGVSVDQKQALLWEKKLINISKRLGAGLLAR